MIEKVIYLEGIEPVNLFGVKNNRLEKLKEYYPKLKIIARGNEIKVRGDENEINQFEEKVDMIVEYLHKFKHLKESEFDALLREEEEGEEMMRAKETSDDNLLYG